MKLSVFTVTMPEFTIEEACAFLKKTGYEGIELRVFDLTEEQRKQPPFFWGNNKIDLGVKNMKAKAKNIRKVCDSYGIKVCNLATYLKVDDIADAEIVCQNIHTFGCNSFRAGVMGYDRKLTYRECYEKTVKNLAKIEKLCKKYKTRGIIEIHMGNIACSASAAHKIVSNFDPKYIGVIHDAGNMVYEGYENYKMGLEILGPYLAHVHIKNASWGLKKVNFDGSAIWEPSFAPVNAGFANLEQLMADLKAVKYDKWLSVEDFNPTEAKEKLKNAHDYLRKIFKKTALKK